MGINNLYSKRKKLTEGGDKSEVYQYTNFPVEFRRQVIHIWHSAIGSCQEPDYAPRYVPLPVVSVLWQQIHDILARELGLFHLGSEYKNPFEKCKAFLLDEDTPTDYLLDLIELTFSFIEQNVARLLQDYRYQNQLIVSQTSDAAVSELNHRFREHAIGYQYNDGQIFRVDSGFIHSEVVISRWVKLIVR